MKTYTDFVFDIDGTLLDTERTGVLSLMQTIRELTGREVSYVEAYGFFGVPSAKASATLGFADKERFAAVWEEHFQELMYLVAPFPGVEELLDALKEKGVRIGLVTSRSRFEIDYDPHLAKLLPRFDALVCSEDSVRHKPFPDPMLAYFAKTGAEAATTVATAIAGSGGRHSQRAQRTTHGIAQRRSSPARYAPPQASAGRNEAAARYHPITIIASGVLRSAIMRNGSSRTGGKRQEKRKKGSPHTMPTLPGFTKSVRTRTSFMLPAITTRP